MGLKKHVTSEAITKLAADLTTGVHSQIGVAKQNVNKCEVAFPAFGVIGLPLAWEYNRVLDDFRTYLDTLDSKLADTAMLLRTKVAPQWEQAEDNNTVRYGDA
jgi:hypothetical protein